MFSDKLITMKAVECLRPDEIRELTETSDVRGWLAVGTTWMMIAGSLTLVAVWPSIMTFVVAWLLLGGRILALAILMHECAHYSLFKTRWLNDWVGLWICGAPAWQDLRRYRRHHLDHHRYAGTSRDPDVSLVTGFPISRASLVRKFARDLAGWSGIRRVAGLVLMDFGFVEYTVANDFKRISRPRSCFEIIREGVTNLYPFVISQLLLLGLLAALDHVWLYGVWVFAYLSSFSWIVRVRSIAEHACTGPGLDPMLNTRTTRAGWLARVTFAPHRVNYHLEHHLLMTVPHFKLPRMHAMLEQRGALASAHLASGYVEVLRRASTLTY